MTANAPLSDEEKIIKIKALQVELAAAFAEEKETNGTNEKEPKSLDKIESILNQIDELTRPTPDKK